MTTPPPTADTLFADALERPAAEREAFVRAAAASREVRDEVLSLLGAHAGAGAFLEVADDDELIGRELGAWRIVREVGAGGMGRVYLAERVGAAFEQHVALKVIKRGMDTTAMLRRFDRERQLLARLDHPGVARLLDGGATDDGRPWFAMEYVAGGVPIDTYCDRHALSIKDRIALFVQACHAVHAAHRSLVVHRDLKPGNLLIAEDGRAKLLDFGIARVLEGTDGAAQTTIPGQRLLTPAYASPEQLAGAPVTTASDVFSLGVLLFRLLTGRNPWPDGPRDAATRPRRASATVTALPDDERTREAQRRQTSPAGWPRQLRGDLDRIVQRAMAAEPDARYASAAALAADLERFLAHEPVEAGPRGATYRLRKLVQRRPLASAFAVGGALALAVTIVALASALLIATRARDAEREANATARAEQATTGAIVAYLRDLLKSPDPWTRGKTVRGRDTRVIDIVRGHAEQLDLEPPENTAVEAQIRQVLGETLLSLDDLEAAEGHLRRAVALHSASRGPLHPQTLDAKLFLGATRERRGDLAEAESLFREVYSARTELLGPDDEGTIIAAGNLSVLLWRTDRLDEAAPLAEAVLAWRRAHLAPTHVDTLRAMSNLALILDGRGETERAERLFREEVDVSRSIFPEDHPQLLTAMSNLAYNLHAQDELDEAQRLLEACVKGCERTLGPDHDQTLDAMNNLGAIYEAKGRFDDACALYEACVESRVRRFGPTSRGLCVVAANLGNVHRKQGRFERALECYEMSINAHMATYGPEFFATGIARGGFGATLLDMGRLDEAETALNEAHRVLLAERGPEFSFTQRVAESLAELESRRTEEQEREAAPE